MAAGSSGPLFYMWQNIKIRPKITSVTLTVVLEVREMSPRL